MIEYVVPGNIDDRILNRTSDILGQGALVALPLDTTWCVACAFHSKEGIKKLRRLSGEREERLFTLLCSDIAQFGDFCSMDNPRFRLIKRLSPGPYTFILKTLLGTEKALGLRRQELGVRIPNHPIPLALIRALGKPLYAITAKRSMIRDEDGESEIESLNSSELPLIPEEELFEGGWELEAVEDLDLILDPGEDQRRTLSTIIDISGDDISVIRQGAGPWPV